MKRGVFGAVLAGVALAGCSGGSGFDGSTGGGGGAGGGAGADAGPSLFANPLKSAAFAVAGADASITISRRTDAGPDDAGRVPFLDLGPDGLTFTPAGAAGALFDSPPFDDGGVMVPFWGLISADGGAEPIGSFTALSALPGGGASGHVLVQVPHFSSAVFVPGAAARLQFDPEGFEKEVGEDFGVSVAITPTGANGAEGTMTIEGLGAIESLASTATFERLRKWSLQIGASCKRPGLGEVVVSGTFTAYQASTWSFTSPTQLPPQSFRISRRVHCRASVPPPQPDPDPVFQTPENVWADPRTTVPPSPLDVYAKAVGDVLSFSANEASYAARVRMRKPECGSRAFASPCPVDDFSSFLFEFQFEQKAPLVRVSRLQVRSHSDQLSVPFAQVHDLPDRTSATSALLTIVIFCRSAGRFAYELSGRVSLYTDGIQSFPLTEEVPVVFYRGLVQCGGAGDAVMLSDNTRLTRSGATWTAGATGTTFNLIAAAPSVEAQFGALDEQNVGYDAVARFTSVPGFPRFRFQSGRQDGGLAFTTDRYVGSGFTGTGAFNPADTFTVTALNADAGVGQLSDGGAAVITLAAPPPLPDPNLLFGPRAGLATPVRLPEGSFDVLYVFAGGASPRGGEGGIFRTVRAAQMSLDGGLREAPLLDARAVRSLAAWGINPTTVYLAAYRQQSVEGLFFTADGGPRPVPVQAGRMVNFATLDLAP